MPLKLTMNATIGHLPSHPTMEDLVGFNETLLSALALQVATLGFGGVMLLPDPNVPGGLYAKIVDTHSEF